MVQDPQMLCPKLDLILGVSLIWSEPCVSDPRGRHILHKQDTAVACRWGACQKGNIHQPLEEEQPWASGSLLHRPAVLYTPRPIRLCARAQGLHPPGDTHFSGKVTKSSILLTSAYTVALPARLSDC